jgi:hypothetical protein
MSDDPKKTGLDRKLISLEQGTRCAAGASHLTAPSRNFRAAVKAAGNSAEKVRAAPR